MYNLFKSLLNAWPTVHPSVMEVVDLQFESVKPLLDQVSLYVIELTAQSDSKEGCPISISINEKHSIRKVMFLGELMKKRSRWISAMSTEQCNLKNQLWSSLIALYRQDCSPLILTVASSTVTLCQQTDAPVLNRFMRAFKA